MTPDPQRIIRTEFNEILIDPETAEFFLQSNISNNGSFKKFKDSGWTERFPLNMSERLAQLLNVNGK